MNNIKVMCSNIRGLSNNFDEFKYVIRKRQPDICFLNETHVTDDCDISDLKLRNYRFISCNSHSKHTGGVCAFIHKKLKFSKLSIVRQRISTSIYHSK